MPKCKKPIIDCFPEELVTEKLKFHLGHSPTSHLLYGLIENAVLKAAE